MANIKVRHDPEKPVAKEILADSIVKIGAALDALKTSGLNEAAIIVLLNHKTKVGVGDIKAVFDGLRRLRGWYCR